MINILNDEYFMLKLDSPEYDKFLDDGDASSLFRKKMNQ